MRQVSLTNLGTRAARDRDDFLRGDRSRAAGRGRGASRLLESLRPDRVRPGRRGAAGRPPAARPRGAGLGGAGDDGAGRDGRHRPVRDGSRALSRARARTSGTRSRSRSGVRSRTPPGTVLDPVFSLRRRVRLAPGATARVHLRRSSPIAGARARARRQVPGPGHVRSRRRASRGRRRRSSCATSASPTDEAHLFQRLATRILYSDPTLRAPVETLVRNRRGPSALWRHGISGDVPIVLVRIDQVEDQGIVRQLLRAHEYWRMKGLARRSRRSSTSSRRRTPRSSAPRSSRSSAPGSRAPASPRSVRAGDVFVLRGDSAHRRGARRARGGRPRRPALTAGHARAAGHPAAAAAPAARAAQPVAGAAARRRRCRRRAIPLDFFNGLGGFSEDGGEYVTLLGERQWTPAPWINVLANASFGCLVSESGSGYTWAGNSRENQLTPWSNDPVSDPPGEALFLRDEETGEIWCPTAAAHPRRRVLRRAPRPGVQPLRARAPRNRDRSARLRSARGSRQDLAAARREPVRVGADASP